MKMIECFELAKERKITSGTKEWADHNVNCIKGCYNNCRYCYAKITANRFGRATEKTWHIMKIRRGTVNKTYRKLPGRVMFPSSHDIFDFPQIEEACFTVLAKLLKSGNDVLVTTKPRIKVIQKIDRLFSIYKERLQFRFTITSIRNQLLSFWEPNAPRFEERMDSLRYAFEKKYKTSVSIEPFLDYDPSALVEIVAPFTTESIWIGRMNYIPRRVPSKKDSPYYEEIRKNYEDDHLWEIYNKLKYHSLIRFKDSIRIQLGMENGN